MSRQLRMRHLLLFVPVLLASAPEHRGEGLAGEARLDPAARNVGVMAGETQGFRMSTSLRSALAGQTFELTLSPHDAYGNPSVYGPTQPVHFSSSDPQAVLPRTEEFGSGTFQVTLLTAGRHSITVTGEGNATGLLEAFPVLPGPFYEVLLSTPATAPVDACTPEVIQLRAADEHGNTVPREVTVTLCGAPGQSLEVTSHTLSNASSELFGCIRGNLSPQGEGQVSWLSRQPAAVDFKVIEPDSPREDDTVRITWQQGEVSAAHSALSFPNAPGAPPQLRTATQELVLLLELRDRCGNAVDPPEDQELSIEAESPLSVSTPSKHEEPGRWTTTVRLPKCPDTTDALKLWPTLDKAPLRRPDGSLLHAEILPLCLPPDVQLELRARPEGAKAVPGAAVEFEVTLSNTGQKVIPEGLLWLEAEALTGLEARVEGEAFKAFSTKLELPELEPGATRTVKLQGQAAVEPEPPVKLIAWYTTKKGDALTEQKVLSLEWDGLGVDVGCGCQTGAPPGQFLPWLVLLVAASRSRSRLRRMTRGERIDR